MLWGMERKNTETTISANAVVLRNQRLTYMFWLIWITLGYLLILLLAQMVNQGILAETHECKHS